MSIKKNISVFIKGMLMGAADVVPGVSGGTIAFITGIYQELITTIDSLDIKMLSSLKKNGVITTAKTYNIGFLLSLIMGVAISVVSLSKILSYLLQAHPIMIWSFFFGLVLASVIYVGRQISKWNVTATVMIFAGGLLSYYITIAEPVASPDQWWYLMLSGFIAIIAMILPGVSGAFLLLLLGSYESVLNSINGCVEALSSGDFNALWEHLKNLIMVGIGAIIGLKLFSKALTWLFENYKNFTLALLTGFMIGSLNKLWPWKKVLKTRINSHGEEVPFLDASISPSDYAGEPFILYASGLAICGFLLIIMLEIVVKEK
jgi:putative membrane protein